MDIRPSKRSLKKLTYILLRRIMNFSNTWDISMLTSNKTVFISYRREPSKFLAIIVCKELQKRGYDVFLDIDSIGGGEFEKIILSQIAARSHFIVLLAHGSLDRCNEAGDWFRREIEYALQLGRTIIPILVDNFTFEISDKYLTGKLREIKNHNALPLYYNILMQA